MGRSTGTMLSKLFAYGVIERREWPARPNGSEHEYLYRTKLPKISSPPAASTESENATPVLAIEPSA
jgi:hypothetical protein